MFKNFMKAKSLKMHDPLFAFVDQRDSDILIFWYFSLEIASKIK